MNRVDAIRQIIKKHQSAAIFFSNGLTSREACHFAPSPNSFYVLHGMGETLSIGIGFKFGRPDLEVVVVEGDGNALMGLSSTALLPIPGLFYYVLSNMTFETTGGQPIPPLPFNVPSMQIIKIDEGKTNCPNPDLPDKIISNFMHWLTKSNNLKGEKK